LEDCAPSPKGARAGPLLVLFLGSTIGNFDRDAGDTFLREMRAILQTGDALLLGTDWKKALSFSCWLTTICGVTAAIQSEFAGADQSRAGRGF